MSVSKVNNTHITYFDVIRAQLLGNINAHLILNKKIVELT